MFGLYNWAMVSHFGKLWVAVSQLEAENLNFHFYYVYYFHLFNLAA